MAIFRKKPVEIEADGAFNAAWKGTEKAHVRAEGWRVRGRIRDMENLEWLIGVFVAILVGAATIFGKLRKGKYDGEKENEETGTEPNDEH